MRDVVIDRPCMPRIGSTVAAGSDSHDQVSVSLKVRPTWRTALAEEAVGLKEYKPGTTFPSRS